MGFFQLLVVALLLTLINLLYITGKEADRVTLPDNDETCFQMKDLKTYFTALRAQIDEPLFDWYNLMVNVTFSNFPSLLADNLYPEFAHDANNTMAVLHNYIGQLDNKLKLNIENTKLLNQTENPDYTNNSLSEPQSNDTSLNKVEILSPRTSSIYQQFSNFVNFNGSKLLSPRFNFLGVQRHLISMSPLPADNFTGEDIEGYPEFKDQEKNSTSCILMEEMKIAFEALKNSTFAFNQLVSNHINSVLRFFHIHDQVQSESPNVKKITAGKFIYDLKALKKNLEYSMQEFINFEKDSETSSSDRKPRLENIYVKRLIEAVILLEDLENISNNAFINFEQKDLCPAN